MNKLQKIREEIEKQLNLLERVAEKLKNGLITSGNVSHTSKVQGYTIENVVNNIKEILQKESISDDLEIEINKEIINLHTTPCYDELEAFALHFIKWQKEQMMKDAVEATCLMLPYPDLFKMLSCYDITDKLKHNDKIKLIPIKEEQL